MDDRAQPQRKEKKEAEAQAAADLIARFEAFLAGGDMGATGRTSPNLVTIVAGSFENEP